jgi:starvation-inducible DNA-binding protein
VAQASSPGRKGKGAFPIMVEKQKATTRFTKDQPPRLFATRIDLPADARTHLIALLNQQLADTFDLYTQTKQAHWNVKGTDFFQLHELFDLLAESIFADIDKLAERATALGGAAQGTARMSANATRLPEFPQISAGMECVRTLAERYAVLARSTRAGIEQSTDLKDLDTADLLTEISRTLDKDLWFLEAHLQEE